eukprot:768348-Hanusia_phi.AAC.3
MQEKPGASLNGCLPATTPARACSSAFRGCSQTCSRKRLPRLFDSNPRGLSCTDREPLHAPTCRFLSSLMLYLIRCLSLPCVPPCLTCKSLRHEADIRHILQTLFSNSPACVDYAIDAQVLPREFRPKATVSEERAGESAPVEEGETSEVDEKARRKKVVHAHTILHFLPFPSSTYPVAPSPLLPLSSVSSFLPSSMLDRSKLVFASFAPDSWPRRKRWKER